MLPHSSSNSNTSAEGRRDEGDTHRCIFVPPFPRVAAIKVQTSLGPGVVYPPIPTILRLQTDPDKMTDDGDLDSSSSSSSGGRLTGKRRRRRQSSSFSPGSPQQSKRLKKSTGPEAFLQAAGELDTPLHHTHSSPQVPMGLDPNLVIPLEQCARTDGMVEVHFSFGRGYLPLKELKELPAETRIEAPLPHLLGGIRDVEVRISYHRLLFFFFFFQRCF